MTIIKKIILSLLVILMTTNGFSAVKAEDTGFSDGGEIVPFEPGPILNEPEDNSEVLELDEEDISAGNLLNSVMQHKLEKDIDELLNYQPISMDIVSDVLGDVEEYLSAGGKNQASSGVPDLLGSSSQLMLKAKKIGLEQTGEELIEVIDPGNNASGYIFVIDRDSLAFRIEDTEGDGIPNALVTITYTDPAGQTVTRSQHTTEGDLPGMCAFKGVKDITYVMLDIQADGYRAKTVLDKRVSPGILYWQLEKAQENDLYLRCGDLAGKDLLFEDTDFFLVESGSHALEMRFIITATGTRNLPSSITLKDRNSGRTITAISDKGPVAPGGTYSQMFTASQDWLKKGGLLQQDDILSVDIGGELFDLSNVRVRNALAVQGTSNEQLPLTGTDKEVPLTDVMGGTGVTAFTFRYLKIPVTIGLFPDGGFIVVATIDIESLSTKYSSLFEESWNPKTRAETESVLEPFKQEFWRKADRFKDGTGKMNDSKRVSFATDKYWSFTASFSVFCSGIYNEKTNNFDGSFGGVFDAKLAGGITQYFLVSAPIVIPFYLGFTISGEFKSGITANFVWSKLSDGIGAAFSAADHAMTQRFDLIGSLELYAGVGLKGMASLEAAGGAVIDFAAVLGTVEEEHKDATRFLIDTFAKLRVTASLAFFNWDIYSKTFGPWRLVDSHPDKVLGGTPADEEEIEFIDTDLSATQEDATLLLQGTDEVLAHYKLNSPGLTDTLVNGHQTISTIATDTFGDNQVRIISTEKTTAMFRIVTIDGKARLVYQKQDPLTGKFNDDFYELPAFKNFDVIEYDVAPSHTDKNWAYIAGVVADGELKDVESRCLSSRVEGIIVDFDEDRVFKMQVMSPLPDMGKYYYFNPRVAGRGENIAVAYQKAVSYRWVNEAVACLFPYTLSGEVQMGQGPIYSSGDIVDGEPSFFIMNRRDSSSTRIFIDGYRANCYFDANHPRLRYSVDVHDYQLRENEHFITNWGYQNGTNYAIIAGKLYYLEKYASDVDEYGYGMRMTQVEKSEGLINRDNIYEFVLTDDNSGLCLVSASTTVDVDMETGENEISGSTLRIYTLEARYSSSDQINKAILHGPLEIFLKGVDISTFAAVFNRENCSSKGLSIVYTDIPERTLSSNGKIIISGNLYQWQQNLKRGMVVTSVDIDDLFMYSDQLALPVFVTYQNIGYAIEGKVAFTIKDETGYVLHEAYYNEQIDEYFDLGPEFVHNTDRVYTGDTVQIELLVLHSPYWESNKVHEINIEIAPAYRGDANISVTSPVFNNKLTLQGDQIVIGDTHYAELSISNIGDSKMAINAIAVETRYKDDSKQPHVSKIDLSKIISDPDNDHYSVRYNLQPIWDRAEQDGVLSVRFCLLDENGQPLTGESVFMYPKLELPEPQDEPETVSYEITEGADGSWQQESESPYQITVARDPDTEKPADHLTSITVDDRKLTVGTDYTVSDDGTIVLSASLLNQLATGEHVITITFVDGEAETTLNVLEPEAPPVEISYQITSGGNAEWTKGSKDTVKIVVKRNVDDETCFSHFDLIAIDGNILKLQEDYLAESGSTIITLYTNLLESLSEGKHNVMIEFDDGEVTAELTVESAEEQVTPPEEETDNPETGDHSNLNLWLIALGVSLLVAVLLIVFIIRRGRKSS